MGKTSEAVVQLFDTVVKTSNTEKRSTIAKKGELNTKCCRKGPVTTVKGWTVMLVRADREREE